MSEEKPVTLQTIIRQRQRGIFVGRAEQVAVFYQNLKLSPDDDRRRFIFDVSGRAGVGKTTLLHRFCQLAQETGLVTAWTDETETSVTAVMGRLAVQLKEQGHELEQFEAAYQAYCRLQAELEADPQAPKGFSAVVTRNLFKTGAHRARHTPLGEVLFDFAEDGASVSYASEWATYVARKLADKDEVRLLLQPIEVLTPLFLRDLRQVANEHAIAFFCDAHEHSGRFLDPWLLEVLAGHHGDAPANIALTIAGLDALDPTAWLPYEGLLTRLPLAPFTEEETRSLLAHKGIFDERAIAVIRELSEDLPLFVAMLAAECPDDPVQLSAGGESAVSCFLNWLDDRERPLALNAAVPRHLDRNALSVLVTEKDTEMLLAWLEGAPFVHNSGGGWVYHEMVRQQMLRQLSHKSPQAWVELHGRLADYYEEQRERLRLGTEKGRRDIAWQTYTLRALYHRLCQSSHQHLPGALKRFLDVLQMSRAFAGRWAKSMQQAGNDAGDVEVQEWGGRLVAGLYALDGGDYAEMMAMLTALLEGVAMGLRQQAIALNWRGVTYRQMRRLDEALADFDRAIELVPEYAKAIANRGTTYLLVERYDDAIADLSRAIELDPEIDWATISRGATYLLVERYDEALADLNQAVEMNPEYARTITSRGITYQRMRRYYDALADFDRAIVLDPEYAWAIARRGATNCLLGRFDEALADLNHAVELSPEHEWIIASRGEIYRQMERYEDALADFDRAVELNPEYAWAIASRGGTYRRMNRFREAMADFDRALALNPDYGWVLANRGAIYQQTRQYEKALADFDRAIECDPDKYWVVILRGVTYWQMKRYEDALADFTRAIALNPKQVWAVASRGETYRQLGRYEDALVDFGRAITLDPDNTWAIASRGETYRRLGRFEDALIDFNRAVELNPDYTWVITEAELTRDALRRQADGE